MGSELKIPKVTLVSAQMKIYLDRTDLLSLPKDDLHSFQLKHFHQSLQQNDDHAGSGTSRPSDNVILTNNGVFNEDEEIQNEDGETYFEDDDDDDGLGYYPDGVKRTLTDEQIAMFRHSEIYSLFRKQQIQDEACDLDEQVNSVPLNMGSIPISADVVVQELGLGHGDDIDEEEYLEFLEAERKQMEADKKRMEVEQKTKKRKFGRTKGSKPHDRAPTHRRIARELDDAITDHNVLNYDEENAETPDLPEEASHDSENKNSRLKGLTSEASTTNHTISATALDDRPKGRKIWWPPIGKQADLPP